ncbi:MAG: hypothetical protein AAF630_18415 [Cyanobacteria bacterium P01_C01_bin.38]
MTTSVLNHVEEKIVSIPIGSFNLQAELVIPLNARGIVLFAHGNGVGRYSTRNRYLAHLLRQTAGVGTVLIDLLTPQEEAIDLRSKHCSSNVQFLAKRLIGVTDWLLNNPSTSNLKIGYFGDTFGELRLTHWWRSSITCSSRTSYGYRSNSFAQWGNLFNIRCSKLHTSSNLINCW